jgi:hypothetical protein
LLYNPASLLDNLAPKEEDPSAASSSRDSKEYVTADEEKEDEMEIDEQPLNQSSAPASEETTMTFARSNRGKVVVGKSIAPDVEKDEIDAKFSIDPSPERTKNKSPERVDLSKSSSRGRVSPARGGKEAPVDLTTSSPARSAGNIPLQRDASKTPDRGGAQTPPLRFTAPVVRVVIPKEEGAPASLVNTSPRGKTGRSERESYFSINSLANGPASRHIRFDSEDEDLSDAMDVDKDEKVTEEAIDVDAMYTDTSKKE